MKRRRRGVSTGFSISSRSSRLGRRRGRRGNLVQSTTAIKLGRSAQPLVPPPRSGGEGISSPRKIRVDRYKRSPAMPLYVSGYRRGIVAAPHRSAAEAGRMILAEGGNALEAMVAMAAAIAAVYPHMNHVGGDGFFLLREASGRIRAIMGAGPAGSGARIELYRGEESIPARGPLAALTVPGAVGAWVLALEAAKAAGGRLPLATLLASAVRHAGDYVVSPSQARLTAEKLSELEKVPGFARAFLVDSKPPESGAKLKQTALAATLEHLSHAGL